MHIQLDNTTGDCKNSTTWGMAAWLVATNRCKGVRLFFLDVGHTHVVIDQVFGVITRGMRGRELLFVEDMMESIDNTLAKNTQYLGKPAERLHFLWDFSSWVKDEMGLHPFSRYTGQGGADADEEGTFRGMHDFLVALRMP